MPRRPNEPYKINRGTSDASIEQHVAAALGYNDAVAGRDFAEWYESASKNVQLAYESGRHWVCDMRAAGIEPPAWLRAGPPPKKVQDANLLAHERGEGYATPYGVLFDTPDRVLLEPLGVRIRAAARGRKRRGRPAISRTAVPPAGR